MNEQTALPTERRRHDLLASPPIGRLRDEIDRLFDDFGLTFPARNIFALPHRATLNPAVELTEADGGYELSIELPGLEEKDVEIEVSEGVLTVAGEKREESEKKDRGYIISERRYGSFRRQLTLPADVDTDTIKADFRQGVLKLTMKKDEEARGRTKKIKIG